MDIEESKEILKKVKKIEITTRKLVDGLISGSYHSLFKGQGIEFSEIREYIPGDDVRAIDWNVTARYQKPYIKEFIEERDLRVYFAFDVSGSGNFGRIIPKKRAAIELVASLMFSAVRNNDNLGAFLFTNEVESFIPARKGKKHAMKILSKLLTHKPKTKETDIAKSLQKISKILKRKTVLFIISDFFSDDFVKELKVLKNKHDVIAINLSDPREKEMPDVGLIELEDEETGEQLLVDTSNEEFRKNYSKILTAHENKLKKQLRKLNIDMLTIETETDYTVLLKRFFDIRKKVRT